MVLRTQGRSRVLVRSSQNFIFENAANLKKGPDTFYPRERSAARTVVRPLGGRSKGSNDSLRSSAPFERRRPVGPKSGAVSALAVGFLRRFGRLPEAGDGHAQDHGDESVHQIRSGRSSSSSKASPTNHFRAASLSDLRCTFPVAPRGNSSRNVTSSGTL